jgi:hypothetical protein
MDADISKCGRLMAFDYTAIRYAGLVPPANLKPETFKSLILLAFRNSAKDDQI